MSRRGAVLVVVALAAACGGDDSVLPVEELMNPETCQTCHPDHYTEWSGSMHAYASEDPIFLAIEARGQAETQGALGDFCVQCHAPLAHRLGLVQTAADLASLPDVDPTMRQHRAAAIATIRARL